MRMNARDLKERRLNREEIFKGRLLHVTRDTVELPNGHQSTRECVWHPGAVVVIPVLEGETLIMERQYRYAPDRIFFELPAGKLDPGEDHLTCGKRELLEETGYTALDWQFVCNIHPAIGFSDELMALYLARDLEYVGINRDADEFLDVMEVSLDDALARLKANQITDAKTQVGLFWAEKILRDGWLPNG